MINKYTDRSGRKWEFEYVKDFDRHGNDIFEILAVWQVVRETKDKKEKFEVEFDIIDTDWIRGQEDRIECEAFGYQVHS
tara:strand:+ start:397 stop:633 length:237 start_codon:yes stop_codon:yes gene_type:complete